MNRIEINIRQRVGNFVKAICAKDIDGVMSLYAPTSFHSISLRPCDTSGLTVNVEPGKESSLN
jgi:hypothetical protein